MQSGSFNSEEISEINVTPFVDVLLVLLIIFMITVPLVTKSIFVNLPEETLNAPIEQNNLELTLLINAKGEYFINNKKIKLEEISGLSQKWLSEDPSPAVSIKADEKVRYKSITTVMSELKNNGINKVGLVIKDKSN